MSQDRQDWIETYEVQEGFAASGPAELQRVGVLKIGRPDARRVLVLVGGREGGAAVFKHTARSLAEASDDLQVWAVDRREQNLADLSGFEGGPGEATEYYLDGHYTSRESTDHLYAAEWGLEVLLEDLRRVILAASDGGRREVVLGGVSVGATAVLLYAAWDFDGTPGYRDLAGLAVVDGGVLNAFSGAGMEFDLPLEAAEGWLAQIEGGAVFEDFTSTTVGLGTRPEDAAVWFQLAAVHAVADPDGPSVLADRLPEAHRTDRKLTNAGLLGLLFDAERGHPSFSVHAGLLEDSGAWAEGGPTRLATVAEAFAGPRPGAWLWYTLGRVLLDYVAGLPFTETDVTRRLGLRVKHGADIDVPLYAFQSGLTNGTTGQAAASVTAASRIPELSLHSDSALTHQDVVYADWESNRFLRTLSRFLKELPATSR
ncbi:alpha/beta hydrolase [Streptomyces sp. DSM 40750]|uniref:alpha/beta hydrolase n=1 Tax=Streptomyces sp. DSM 40750 TaxID=2801030 RepID=UPI00214C5CAF|nr:alpha/beta hydrolase [Streptomyces sp. DSM 40750]UUU22361.1 alpha/beta hydrolase [Streptomyces sp. DSM 40750]